jgi:glyoxylase-like metal-dependent hydrolase (beta-lactamase superfamily II)
MVDDEQSCSSKQNILRGLLMSQNQMSRRDFLKGIGAGVLAGLFGGQALPAFAQVSAPSGGLFGVYRFAVGGLQFTAIKDNVAPLNTGILGTEEQAADVVAELASNNLPTDELLNTFNIMMIESSDGIFLVDSGLGVALIPTMETLGMSPADVTGIIGTHWHPDHVGGLSSEGVANFPNATYYLSQTEYDFVQANAEAFTGGAAAAIAPYADNDQLSLYNADDEIITGVQAVAAPGHTPGHHALLMSSGGNQIMHMVDTAISAFVHVANPAFAVQFDADPVQASETRVSLLSRAADEQIPVIGYHFPFPGVGYITRTNGDDRFRFVPYN